MPPSKCEDAVLEYLTRQNRPYSVNDVVLNLHKEHGKAAVQKALDVLVADAKVKEKVGGGCMAMQSSKEDLYVTSTHRAGGRLAPRG